MVLVQIEHVDAVRNMDDLLRVPGLDGVCVGPNDLSGSMNKLGQIDDPEVVAAIDEVLQKTSRMDVFAGISVGYDSVSFAAWIEKGAHWINLSTDWLNLAAESRRILAAARAQLGRVVGLIWKPDYPSERTVGSL